MNDQKLVAAVCESRGAFQALAKSLDPKDFTEAGRAIVELAARQYARDEDLRSVDRDVLRTAIQSRFPVAKQAAAVTDYLEALPKGVTAGNVAAEYRKLRQHKVGIELAARLGSGQHNAYTDALIEKYHGLAHEASTRKRIPSLDDLVSTFSGDRVRLVPGTVNSACNGGAIRGHHILMYARPEGGKSAFAINMAVTALFDGLRVLYCCNEEPADVYVVRFLSRIAKADVNRLQTDTDYLTQIHAKTVASTKFDWSNLIVQHEVWSTSIVEELMHEYEPDVVFVDQLRNVSSKGRTENRTTQLDRVANDLRQLAISHKAVVVSLTQAAESAEGKLKLDMGDVDSSNTAIPGAVDIMYGIGHNEAWYDQDRRLVTLAKNKCGGSHASFPVHINRDYTVISTRKWRP